MKNTRFYLAATKAFALKSNVLKQEELEKIRNFIIEKYDNMDIGGDTFFKH